MKEENLRKVQYLHLVQLFSQKEQVYIISTIVATFLSIYTSQVTGSQSPYYWLSTFTIYLAARYFSRVWFQKNVESAKEDPNIFENIHTTVSLYAGLQWGIFALIFIDPIKHNDLFFVCLASITGIAAGSIPTNAASKKSSIVYLLSLLVPIVIVCTRLEAPMSYMMSSLSVLFITVMIRGAVKIHSSIFENIKLRIENEEIYQELKQSEESKMLARLEAYENSKMASIGKMSAGLAHEINNPLTVINGHIRIMARSCTDKSKIMQNGFKQSLENIERISSIIHSLRNVSKVDGNKEKEVFDIRDSIQEIINLSREKMKIDKITLIYDPPLTNMKVESHKSVVADIIISLINQSIYHATKNTEAWIQINLTTNHNYIMVEIIDSSLPIEEDKQDRIFDPFFSTSSILDSTGVNLSKAKLSAQNFGGDLKYNKNSFNRSFTLYICLPEDKSKKVA